MCDSHSLCSGWCRYVGDYVIVIFRFGDADHIRIYGRDYKDWLEECGFRVEIRKYLAEFSEADIRRCGLAGVHDFRIAAKPAG